MSTGDYVIGIDLAKGEDRTSIVMAERLPDGTTRIVDSPSVEHVLALRYVYETEEYDRSVCSGKSPRTGDAMPVDTRERRLSTGFAHRLHQELSRHITNWQEFKRECQDWEHMGHEIVTEHYRRLFFERPTNQVAQWLGAKSWPEEERAQLVKPTEVVTEISPGLTDDEAQAWFERMEKPMCDSPHVILINNPRHPRHV